MRLICWLFGHGKTYKIEAPEIPEIPTWVCCERCNRRIA